MKPSAYYRELYDQLGHSPMPDDEKMPLGRLLLNAKTQTDLWEKVVLKALATTRLALEEATREAAEMAEEQYNPGLTGTGYYSAPLVAGRIQRTFVWALANAGLDDLTTAAAQCQKAQDAVEQDRRDVLMK